MKIIGLFVVSRYSEDYWAICWCHCAVRYRELGENMADDELRAMIDEFDHDGDGESM